MEAFIVHGLNLAWDFWNSLDGKWYYTIGVVLATLPITALLLQGIKRLHLKWTGVEMTNHFIDFTLWVTGFLMAAADFVITNGNNLKYLPQFLLVVVPVIKAAAPTVYTWSKVINNWTINRKNETQKQRQAATLKLANSFGTQANRVTAPQTPTQPQPAPNLLQL